MTSFYELQRKNLRRKGATFTAKFSVVHNFNFSWGWSWSFKCYASSEFLWIQKFCNIITPEEIKISSFNTDLSFPLAKN